MHFGYFMDEPKIATGNYHLHVPLRHPRDVASSWARRGKNLDRLVEAYRCMFTHLQQPHTVHKMEDIAVLSGDDDWDREVNGDGQVSVYVDRIMADVVQPHAEFFSQYYEDLNVCKRDANRQIGG